VACGEDDYKRKPLINTAKIRGATNGGTTAASPSSVEAQSRPLPILRGVPLGESAICVGEQSFDAATLLGAQISGQHLLVAIDVHLDDHRLFYNGAPPAGDDSPLALI
jgi:hypothetical protein